MSVPILTPRPQIMRWECPNCDKTAVTHRLPGPGYDMAEMHTCRNGLVTPMVPEGTKAKVEHVERDDYLGDDIGNVQVDDAGRPIMAAIVTRDDGEDRAVYAPTTKGFQ